MLLSLSVPVAFGKVDLMVDTHFSERCMQRIELQTCWWRSCLNAFELLTLYRRTI
jgi:hypothetical protein